MPSSSDHVGSPRQGLAASDNAPPLPRFDSASMGLERHNPRLREVLPVIGILCVFALFAFMTWAHWGNLRVDCGREMYVPQELANGRLLYRDVWYPYGPLAPYWNALLFRLFGTSLYVLYASGLCITLAFALTFYAVSCRVSSAWVAFVAVMCFLMQAFHPGLFNYVLPYAYGSTLGSLLGLLTLLFLMRHTRRESGQNLFWAGTCAGLTLLTKWEFGLACYATLGAAILADLWLKKNRPEFVSNIKKALPGVLIPIIGYGVFVWKLSLTFFIRDSFSREFYVQWSRRQGFRFLPGETLRLIALLMLCFLVWMVVAQIIKWIIQSHIHPLLWFVLLASLLAALHLKWGAYFPLAIFYASRYFLAPKGMFWLAAAVLVRTALRAKKTEEPSRDLELFVLVFYALAVGIRILANVEMANYSIYYNTGLYLIFFLILWEMGFRMWRFPDERRRQAVSNVLIGLAGLGLMTAYYPWRVMPTAPFHSTRGLIYSKPDEAAMFPAVVQFMQLEKREGKTVLIVPEETSLYFFAGVEAPTRWYMIHPYILDPEWKEKEYIRGLEARKVDYILFSNRSNAEYGFPFFGIDYNQAVYQWIQDQFEITGEFGHFARETPENFAMLIYRRRGETSKPPELAIKMSRPATFDEPPLLR
ncbi:MAG: glycosyltransferase family 39 protein [Acidobacteriia bacterium]|nr:glycosyltransferase family 39 protein [Terriglobia bacterium]